MKARLRGWIAPPLRHVAIFLKAHLPATFTDKLILHLRRAMRDLVMLLLGWLGGMFMFEQFVIHDLPFVVVMTTMALDFALTQIVFNTIDRSIDEDEPPELSRFLIEIVVWVLAPFLLVVFFSVQR